MKIVLSILDYNKTDLTVFVIIANKTKGFKLMVHVQNVCLLKRFHLMVNHVKRLLANLDKNFLKEGVLIVNCMEEQLVMAHNVDIPVNQMKRLNGMEAVKNVGMALWHHLWIINHVLQMLFVEEEKK